MASSKTGAGGLESRVETLEQQMAEVLAKPAFRRSTERGVCMLGHKPSAECPFASLGRFQGGCRGDGCLSEQQQYYQNYRARRKAEAQTNGGSTTKVAAPVKRKKELPKKVGAKAVSPPVKRGVKRRGS